MNHEVLWGVTSQILSVIEKRKSAALRVSASALLVGIGYAGYLIQQPERSLVQASYPVPSNHKIFLPQVASPSGNRTISIPDPVYPDCPEGYEIVKAGNFLVCLPTQTTAISTSIAGSMTEALSITPTP